METVLWCLTGRQDRMTAGEQLPAWSRRGDILLVYARYL